MQKTMTYAKGAYIYFLISFLSIPELAAANMDSYFDIDSTLAALFKYRKQKKDKITDVQKGLAERIQLLLKKEYVKREFKEALGGVDPTKNDKHIFVCLQWAYQKGSQNVVNNELAISESLVALFKTWRKKPDNTIQDMKDRLPQKICTLIQTKSCIVDNNFVENIGFSPKPKDIELAHVLQWAYHLEDKASFSPETKEKTPPINRPKSYEKKMLPPKKAISPRTSKKMTQESRPSRSKKITQKPLSSRSKKITQKPFPSTSKEMTPESSPPTSYHSFYWLLTIGVIGGIIGHKIYYKDRSKKLTSGSKEKKRNQRVIKEE